jgi:hypothetical protein
MTFSFGILKQRNKISRNLAKFARHSNRLLPYASPKSAVDFFILEQVARWRWGSSNGPEIPNENIPRRPMFLDFCRWYFTEDDSESKFRN